MAGTTNSFRLTGLVAATYTPFGANCELKIEVIAPMVEHLLKSGVEGMYVCGSTGEGISLSSNERCQVAEAYVSATRQRVPVVVQVGHNSTKEARKLASHAQDVGADAVSATCPHYFKIHDVETLIECMSEIAGGAPKLPFYYYHIPALTGSTIDMVEFLLRAKSAIPNLVGLKYTDTKLFEFQTCLELNDGQFDVVWGCDEMLLGAWATGAKAAIGSTYNVATPLYQRMIEALQQGDFSTARTHQSRSILMIRTLQNYSFHSAMKALLTLQGLELGGCRLPQTNLAPQQVPALKRELEDIGFFDWSGCSLE